MGETLGLSIGVIRGTGEVAVVIPEAVGMPEKVEDLLMVRKLSENQEAQLNEAVMKILAPDCSECHRPVDVCPVKALHPTQQKQEKRPDDIYPQAPNKDQEDKPSAFMEPPAGYTQAKTETPAEAVSEYPEGTPKGSAEESREVDTWSTDDLRFAYRRLKAESLLLTFLLNRHREVSDANIARITQGGSIAGVMTDEDFTRNLNTMSRLDVSISRQADRVRKIIRAGRTKI